jgi:hypothetical protein
MKWAQPLPSFLGFSAIDFSLYRNESFWAAFFRVDLVDASKVD